MDIKAATTAYETWLGAQIPLIEADVIRKHQRMAQSPFPFMRATFYRWVQLWPQVCSELAVAPRVLGVGDLHVENFGMWRDTEGRLVWGVNDFDEAAAMPYTNDLVRLAVSAGLAINENELSCDLASACEAILTGYRAGFEKDSLPFVLAERHAWLYEWGTTQLRDPVPFWQKFEQLPTISKGMPAPALAILKRSLPEKRMPYRIVHRQSGLGSLGRRRYAVLADWRGGKVAREVKELAVSAWHWEKKKMRRTELDYQAAMDRAVRMPDPFVRVEGRWLLRRLAPDCTRIELGSMPKPKSDLKLLAAMGRETAHIHLGTRNAAGAVLKDFNKRPSKWLHKAAEKMSGATLDDWKVWDNYFRRGARS